MNQPIIRTYSELITFETFEERFQYLKLDGSIGEDTFGFDRYLNQLFYRSPEWRQVRNFVITRDLGCDLAIPEREIINQQILIHHMNPLTKDDIINKTDFLLNPEYLICTTKRTHNAIHYSDDRILIPDGPVVRTKNDQCPWRH
ncbi:hypothetical protein [uncultured Eubacterium sp.]|uniref:hypothetical protein n=1 Tax=uncultured Eubacterium sp. TaxID=165185 RepID=UPI00259A104D|nr:hypothetical protein [uncultured Eubacterium sp.]